MKTSIDRFIKVLFVTVLYLIITPHVYAATYYVSPTGNNSNPGTYDQPWQTITYATNKMSGGDTLILKNGTYIGTANRISPPSGSAGNYTIIKAENDWKAIIDGNGEYTTWDYPVSIVDKFYIQIEGIKITNGSVTAAVFITSSHHIKVLRTSIWNGIQPKGREANQLQIRGSSSYVLVEDVWITGAMRYGIIIYKDSQISPGPRNIIIRRAVVRWDYSCSEWPKAGITVYGNVNGEPLSEAPRDILIQNSIVLDTNPGDNYINMWGGFFNTGVTQNVRWIGNIALNIKGYSNPCIPGYGCSYPTPYAGFIPNENRLVDGGNNEVINSAAWDISGSGLYIGPSGDNAKTTTIDRFTAGYMGNDTYGGAGRGVTDTFATTKVTVKNSLFYNNKAVNPGDGPGAGGSYTESYNSYYPASIATMGASNSITSDPKITYITRVETDSPNYGSGEAGSNRGANIIYRYGADGTLWGEAGYDQLTSVRLWPWPYENQIKADFSQPNDPPNVTCENPDITIYPKTNNVRRGFAATGNGLYGGPITLTSYIWEYIGNPCPSDICSYGRPSPPQNLQVK